MVPEVLRQYRGGAEFIPYVEFSGGGGKERPLGRKKRRSGESSTIAWNRLCCARKRLKNACSETNSCEQSSCHVVLQARGEEAQRGSREKRCVRSSSGGSL